MAMRTMIILVTNIIGVVIINIFVNFSCSIVTISSSCCIRTTTTIGITNIIDRTANAITTIVALYIIPP